MRAFTDQTLTAKEEYIEHWVLCHMIHHVLQERVLELDRFPPPQTPDPSLQKSNNQSKKSLIIHNIAISPLILPIRTTDTGHPFHVYTGSVT